MQKLHAQPFDGRESSEKLPEHGPMDPCCSLAGDVSPSGPASKTTTDQSIELRDASPIELAGCLRSMLGLDPNEPAPGERASSIGRPLPAKVEGLDAGAWIAWCLVGLPLFAGPLPNLRLVKATAGRVAMALAMMRSEGNLTKASAVLRIARRTLRDHLRLVDLHPWRRRAEGEQVHGGAAR